MWLSGQDLFVLQEYASRNKPISGASVTASFAYRRLGAFTGQYMKLVCFKGDLLTIKPLQSSDKWSVSGYRLCCFSCTFGVSTAADSIPDETPEWIRKETVFYRRYSSCILTFMHSFSSRLFYKRIWANWSRWRFCLPYCVQIYLCARRLVQDMDISWNTSIWIWLRFTKHWVQKCVWIVSSLYLLIDNIRDLTQSLVLQTLLVCVSEWGNKLTSYYSHISRTSLNLMKMIVAL